MSQDSSISFDCKNIECYIRTKVTYFSDLCLVVPVVIYGVGFPTLNPHDLLPPGSTSTGTQFVGGGTPPL